MRTSVTDYCAKIGSDPLLVQGAGGNVSWKEDTTLWVKGSGTWLANAQNDEIFVPVALTQLQDAILQNDYSATPQTLFNSKLRPSIETMLHALLPHKVVVHVHAVEILAHLVRSDFKATFVQLLGDEVRWIAVGYHKPGAELAQAIAATMELRPDANVVFLQNHGVVVGGENVAKVDRTLRLLTTSLSTSERLRSTVVTNNEMAKMVAVYGYEPVPLSKVQQLAIDPYCYYRLHQDWALYPDHVVFLGAEPILIESKQDILQYQLNKKFPDLIFVKGTGVFQQKDLGAARYAYLQCYYEVISRQDEKAELVTLQQNDIAALLNWEAEKFRQAS